MTKKDPLLRKQEIIEVALKLFISKGYEETSTNDIMEMLNISRGGLYHHFGSKEEILDSAITTLLSSEKARVELVLDDDNLSSLDKLKIVTGFDSSSQSLADEVTTLAQAKDNPTLITHLLRKKLEIITPLFANIIKQGIKEGVFNCNYPEEVSKMIIILSTVLFSGSILHMSLEEFMEMIKAFQDTTEAMLGAAPSTFDFMSETIKIIK